MNYIFKFQVLVLKKILSLITISSTLSFHLVIILTVQQCRHKLYLVGYRVTHGGWVLLNGEYPERVSGCLRVSFPAFNERGNLSKSIQLILSCTCLLVFLSCTLALLIAVEPIQVDLGTSYSSLEKNSVGRENLKLNRWAIINAVNVLKHASLGMSFKKKNLCNTYFESDPDDTRSSKDRRDFKSH